MSHQTHPPTTGQGLGYLTYEGKEKRLGKRGMLLPLMGTPWKTCFFLMLGIRISVCYCCC